MRQTDIKDAAAELREAAASVSATSGSTCAGEIPALLAQLEAALRELSSASYALGPCLVPRPEGMTHERQALALSTLHEVGAALGGAARRCRQAQSALDFLEKREFAPHAAAKEASFASMHVAS